MFDSDDYYIEKEPELKGEVKKKKSIKDTLIGFVKNNKELIHAYKKEWKLKEFIVHFLLFVIC